MKRDQGFNLIELTVVVVLLSLLALLLIPVATTAQGKGQDVTCIDNLHQMSKGLEMAMQTGHPWLGKDVYPSYAGRTANSYRFTWYTTLAEHMGVPTDVSIEVSDLVGKPDVFHCPFARNAGWEFHTLSYGYNFGSFGDWSSGSSSSGYKFRSRFDVPHPKNTVVICDSNEDGVFDSEVGRWPAAFPGTRHMGGANAIYADGHASWGAFTDIFDQLVVPFPLPIR